MKKGLDKEELLRLYNRGWSLSMLKQKYGVGIDAIRSALLSMGAKMRSSSEQLLFESGGWRKLSKPRGFKTRILSIPSVILFEAGVNPEKELEGKWRVLDKGRLELLIRERRKDRA